MKFQKGLMKMAKRGNAMRMKRLLTIGTLLLCGTAFLGGCGNKSSSGPPTADEKASFGGDPSKMPAGARAQMEKARGAGANKGPGVPAGR